MNNKEVLFGLLVWFIFLLLLVGLTSPKYEKICYNKCELQQNEKQSKAMDNFTYGHSDFYNASWYNNGSAICFPD